MDDAFVLAFCVRLTAKLQILVVVTFLELCSCECIIQTRPAKTNTALATKNKLVKYVERKLDHQGV